MSFEGYYQVICENGHVESGVDLHSLTSQSVCGYNKCRKRIQWYHLVDITNGYDSKFLDTSDAALKSIEHDEDWSLDIYGNVFCKVTERYEPVGLGWEELTHTDVEDQPNVSYQDIYMTLCNLRDQTYTAADILASNNSTISVRNVRKLTGTQREELGLYSDNVAHWPKWLWPLVVSPVTN